MTKPITPEMIAAWRTLRTYGERLPRYVNPTAEERGIASAIRVLDDSDYMVPIEEAEEGPDAADWNSPEDAVYDQPDPAEWGDTTREDMARHQGCDD